METSSSADQLTVVAAPDAVDNAYASYFDFLQVKPRLDKLIGDWWIFRYKANKYRNARRIDLDVEELRAKNLIAPDETMIPTRIIDYNIMRDKADAMGFLNSANRLAYFRCIDDPLADTRQLESDFTKGLTYEDWYLTFDRHYDGAALHGWDSIEVVYDETKPLHVKFEHVGYDRLIFNAQVKSIQDSSFLLLESKVTELNLQEMVVDEGFNDIQVQLMTQKGRASRNDDKVYTIYKVYFKFQGCVYVAWYSRETGINGWLKDPEHARIGLLVEQQMPSVVNSIGSVMSQGGMNDTGNDNNSLPIPPNLIPSDVQGYFEEKLEEYPVFLYIYMEDEQQCICDKAGRGFLDMPLQEAVTSVTSSYVNSMMRAQNVFAAPKQENEETNKLEDITLENGTILPVPMDFFHMDYPDPSVLQGLQYLDAANSQQTGKMAVSVANREDSRKTAKELSLAEKEQNKLSSTDLATYNDYLRKLYAFCWKIVQRQASAGQIELCMINVPTEGTAGIQDSMWVNDKGLITKKFDVRAAGEIDVLQKNEQINAMMQDWPVMVNTPIAQAFLEDFIRLRYPLRADYYIMKMQQGDAGKQVVSSLLGAVTGMIKNPQEVGQIQHNPQQMQQMEQIIQSANQYLAPKPAPK